MSDLPSWLVPGLVLDGKYALVRAIGKGGMGAIYEAQHTTIGGRVAIKVLLDSERTPDANARFLREARATFSIASEHIARVLDAGATPNREPYLVMELLEGADLSKLLAQRGPLEIIDAVEYVAQAAVGLGAAHALGIVHRDVKPANVFLTRRADGAALVKVLDFGIAKGSEPFHPQLTETTAAFGTLPYMSPEQVKASRDVDARADIYSLGVVLFELLTGRPLFSAPSAAELVVEILHTPGMPVRALRSDVPPALEAVIARATSKFRDERYATAEAFAHAARTAIYDLLPVGISGAVSSATSTTPLAKPLGPPSPLAMTAPPGMAPHGGFYPPYPPTPLVHARGPNKVLVGTGGVVTTGGVLSFVAAAIPGIVNRAETGTAIAIGAVACVVGGALLAGGLTRR